MHLICHEKIAISMSNKFKYNLATNPKVSLHYFLGVRESLKMRNNVVLYNDNCSAATQSLKVSHSMRIRIFIVEDKAVQNGINLKTTSLYVSSNIFQWCILTLVQYLSMCS